MTRPRPLAVLLWTIWAAGASGQVIPYSPADSVWSRLTGHQVPTEESTATAADLAPALGLTSLGPDDQGFEIFQHEGTGMQFVFVPGGPFTMGSDHEDTLEVKGKMAGDVLPIEQPANQVWVSPFFIGLYEVTVAEYRPFLEAVERGEVAEHEYPFTAKTQDHRPLHWDRPELGFLEDRQPVPGVHWLSAWAFSSWMGGRLPTEAEWEKAARGTDGRRFPWGNKPGRDRSNTYHAGNFKTTPVGLYPGGRSPYGCHDMIGNVCEYVLDAFERDTYQTLPPRDPCLLERNGRLGKAMFRISRGGGWSPNHGTVVYTRATARCREYPFRWEVNAMEEGVQLWSGLRVVLSPHKDLYPEGWLEERRIAIQTEREQLQKEDPDR